MNQILPAPLLTALRQGTAGSGLILTGGGDLLAAARTAAAAMECQNRKEAPCGRCGPCRKVLAGIHPDVTVVRDDAHKMISMEILRAVRADAYVLPNEGLRKVCIFPDCTLLDPGTQNVLLKVLEEGPPHQVFLFCAPSAGALLPTIRSRCTRWRLEGEEQRPAEEPQAAALCELLARQDRPGLTAFFTELETARRSREELQAILEQAGTLTAEALLIASGCREGGGVAGEMARRLPRNRLGALSELLREQARQLRFNLNVGHAAGGLSAALWQLLR